MQSPFPGMDPYVEAVGLWEDFHHDLITEIKRAISAVLPERYVVLAGERSYVVLSEGNGAEEFLANPDVGIARLAGASPSAGGGNKASATTAVLGTPEAESEPVTMRPLVEAEYREGFLEIREIHPERKLVTCIEVLSPSNKRPVPRAGTNTSASGRRSWKERLTSWKSIFSAAAGACPCKPTGRKVLITCSSPETGIPALQGFPLLAPRAGGADPVSPA